jgi:hypothetical protein
MTIQSHDVLDVPHEVHRLTIDVGAPFDEFRTRYEQAVPAMDAPTFERLKKENADWATILRATAENAPHDFMIYWTYDSTSIMRLAGDQWRCVQYLMGNHTIAQRMFHHDPAVMLYAPLRTMIYQDQHGTTWFAVDQPSTKFAGFDSPEISDVGIELDRKLAALLEYLGTPVPTQLTSGSVPTTGNSHTRIR